jgi:signal transduction histidine kinase
MVIVTAVIFCLIAFIITVLFYYRKKQIEFENNIETLRLDHEKEIMKSQLEIQEETFKHISREIHDNINLSLTLAKLHLNTYVLNEEGQISSKIISSIELISNSISELRNISKGLDSDVISQQGLIKAVELEVHRLNQLGIFQIEFLVNGSSVFFDAKKDLVVFRIIQEALNNILKHANANSIMVTLDYSDSELTVSINDNGQGFDANRILENREAGLKNMKHRTKTLNGKMELKSVLGQGTEINLKIPL